MLKLQRKEDGQYVDLRCAVCAGSGQITPRQQLMRFKGLALQKERNRDQVTLEQRARYFGLSVDIYKAIEAGTQRAPIRVTQDLVVTMDLERNYETMGWIARAPRSRRNRRVDNL